MRGSVWPINGRRYRDTDYRSGFNQYGRGDRAAADNRRTFTAYKFRRVIAGADFGRYRDTFKFNNSNENETRSEK